MKLQLEFETEASARIKVVGVGGAGGNAVNRMIESGFTGVDFVAVNTDAQALECSLAPHRVQIGKQLTHGLGSGGNPDVGRKAIEEDAEQVANVLRGADMVFIAAGMGGGTGTGAGPVVANMAKKLGSLVVAEDPVALVQAFGVACCGPFTGRLSNEGETLTLRDGSGNRMDAVDYKRGFPWPTDTEGRSIELVNPGLDNSLGASWRACGYNVSETTTQAPERSDILNVGGFSDAVFSVVAAFLADDAGRFVAEVEKIEL